MLCTLLLLTCSAGKDAFAQAAAELTAFDRFVNDGRKALAEGKLEDALIAALAASKQDEQRFEGHALAALALEKQGKTTEALSHVDKALARAPENKRAQLDQIRQRLSQEPSNPASSPSGQRTNPGALKGDARHKYDVLTLILEEADKAETADERRQSLAEFLSKSEPFLATYPMETNLWIARAMAAIELDRPKAACLAGKQLKSFGMDESNDLKARKAMAMLERKGWLGETDPEPEWLRAQEAPFLWTTSGRYLSSPFATGFAVVDASGVVSEQDEANNAYPQSVHVVAAWVPRIVDVPVLTNGNVRLTVEATGTAATNLLVESAGTSVLPIPWGKEVNTAITTNVVGIWRQRCRCKGTRGFTG